ncbi:helix-turn-helix transcriptional regulator [Streptomyces sp. SID12488]|nr:helix-turn-helix transcriptional regulator [Streptomyces sp. SID12488]
MLGPVVTFLSGGEGGIRRLSGGVISLPFDLPFDPGIQVIYALTWTSGYLTWWRMASAARLLRASDAPLRSVAVQVGYTSEFPFAHAFKRAYGAAPGAYRRSG